MSTFKNAKVGDRASTRQKLKIDTPVLVKTPFSEWVRRHFAGWAEDGKMLCWELGTTSWSVQRGEGNEDGRKAAWEEWKLPEERQDEGDNTKSEEENK